MQNGFTWCRAVAYSVLLLVVLRREQSWLDDKIN